ncbi:MAG: DNA repair protein RecO, partial [Anaerovoracaceae bacterium]
MYTETEGIILKQTKIVGGRRMVLLFSKKFGKISAGSSINEKGKGKSALAMRPFTHGRYELFKKNDFFNINGAQAIKSFYHLGEEVGKYMCASYGLEFTEKILQELQPAPRLFNLTIDFLAEMERRKSKHETLLLAYEVKALKELGYTPQLSQCVLCNSTEERGFFSIKD